MAQEGWLGLDSWGTSGFKLTWYSTESKEPNEMVMI